MSYIKIPKAEIAYSDENYIKVIGENIAASLFGGEITGSVSSFETFASCSSHIF